MSSANLEKNDIEDNNKNNCENVEKPIEPEIYQPLNNNDKFEQNISNNYLENKSENKIKELIKITNENRSSKKEKYLEDKLLEKYSKDLKNEIYDEEYKKLYNKIKTEISFKIKEELLLKKQKEVIESYAKYLDFVSSSYDTLESSITGNATGMQY